MDKNCKHIEAGGFIARIMGKIYATIIQAILLYGSESWVKTAAKMRKLMSSHNRAARHMTRIHISKVREDRWEYQDMKEVLEECGLEPIENYIVRRRNTLWKYPSTNKRRLMRIIEGCSVPAQNVTKVLWWR